MGLRQGRAQDRGGYFGPVLRAERGDVGGGRVEGVLVAVGRLAGGGALVADLAGEVLAVLQQPGDELVDVADAVLRRWR
jgi:hypothetical protein